MQHDRICGETAYKVVRTADFLLKTDLQFTRNQKVVFMDGWYIKPNQITSDGYLGYESYDQSPITVMQWEGESSYPMHRHHYYELVLVPKGVSVHEYRGVKTPLFPGDVVIIEPDEWHGYNIGSMNSYINCKIVSELLMLETGKLKELRRTIVDPAREAAQNDLECFSQLLQTASKVKMTISDEIRFNYQEELNAQGVIHLSGESFREVETLLLRIKKEQQETHPFSRILKFTLLQEILVILCRIGEENRTIGDPDEFNKKEMISRAISYMDEHMDEKISFAAFAEENYVSLGYYRTIFKQITGLSPVDYLNRKGLQSHWS